MGLITALKNYKLPVRTGALLIAGSLQVSLLSGCLLLPREEEPVPPPLKVSQQIKYNTITVKKSTIKDDFTEMATYVPTKYTDLFYKDRGGRLKFIGVTEGQKVKKGDILAEIDTDSLESDIKQQEIAVKLTQLDYNKAKEISESKYDIEKAKLNMQSARLKLDQLKAELTKARLISPVAGEVVYVADIKAGDNVYAFQKLVRIADPGQLQLEYSGENTGKFKLGRDVKVSHDYKFFTRKVVRVPANMPREIAPELRNVVRIDASQIPGADIGEVAYITYTIRMKENIIKVPVNVVKEFYNRKFVYVLKNGLRVERDVKVGIETESDVEIVSGLEVGDQVIEG